MGGDPVAGPTRRGPTRTGPTCSGDRPRRSSLGPGLALVPLTALLGALPGLAGCAGDAVVRNHDGGRAGFVHRELGYRIDAPAGPGGPWRRIDLEGADLAFRGGDGEGPVSFSLLSRCRDPWPDVEPAILARHLLIGSPRRELLAAGPGEVAGRPAWIQVLRTTGEGGRPAAFKSVTARLGDCVFDWILVASGEGAMPGGELERSFDAWWESFRFDRAGPSVAPSQSAEGDAP